jgi:hypothetical protein
LLWKGLVPVAFHVDYFDHLGWRDKWGSKTFSERQRAYARAWRTDSVYTPGFVLNGKEWADWSRASSLPSPSDVMVGVLKVASYEGQYWRIEFTPARPAQTRYEAQAAFLLNGLDSKVAAGENRGRQLAHDFVAAELTKGSLSPTGITAVGTLSLPRPKTPAKARLALVVWVTAFGSSEPLQATGGWIPDR